MSGKQQTLDGHVAPKRHLSPKSPGGGSVGEAKKSCEWFCTLCGARVTVSPTDVRKEYGHRGGCNQRIPRGDER